MKKVILLLSTIITGLAAQAQVIVTTSTLNYVQDFNSLDTNAATASAILPTGWSIFEYGTSTSANNQYKGSNGNSNTGETYSFGTTGTNERALGSLASGTLLSQYGVKFVNNTGSTITGFTISYRGEEWRFGQVARTNVDSLRFLYSTTAANVSDTTTGLFTENLALMFNTPNMAAAAAGLLDGNAAGNFTVKTGTINVSVAQGGTLIIKWVDPNIAGSDDGLAIDDVNITFTTSGTGPISNKPIVTALSPLNNATNVAAGANLQITFNKPVTKGLTGGIVIRNQTDATLLTKLTSSSDVTVSGNTATIANTGLVAGKTYWIGIDSNSFDSAGYKYAGIYDSTSWKFTTVPLPNYRPSIVIVSPLDNASSVTPSATSSLKMAFSRKVVMGAGGTIIIKNETNGTNQIKATGGADVTLNATGDTATVANVNLGTGMSYHVLVDSLSFDTAGYTVVGIKDTTRWNFSTQGPVLTVNGLTESFEASCSSNLPAGWLQYSVSGPSQFWKCTNTTTNYALVMNGGSGSGSTENEDWLITPRIDPAGLTNIMLAFKAKYRFAGPDMEVKFSIGYNGVGNPNNAVWSNLAGITFTAADSNVFNQKTAAIPAVIPFFVAFKYTSTQSTPSNAREWTIDSVFLKGVPTSVATINSNGSNMPLNVLGTATNGHVVIGFDLGKESAMQVAICDLTGRVAYTKSVQATKGNNKLTLEPQTLQSGMYIIRITNGTQQGIARTFIQ